MIYLSFIFFPTSVDILAEVMGNICIFDKGGPGCFLWLFCPPVSGL